MNRHDAIWYYRLGGQTLGPISWAEIEQLTRDTINAQYLLVARGGDAGWQSAADVPAEHPELTVAATGVVEEWSPPEEPDEAAPTSAAWEPAAPEPSAAAAEVLGVAAVTRATRRSAPTMPGAWSPNEMPRKHGLGAWIGQAWEMVTGDAATFIFGTVLAGLVTVVTLGIAGPPLQAGLFIMAVKRFRKEPVSAGTVFEGFQYFLPSWGVVLLQVLIGGLGGALIGGAIGGFFGAIGADREMLSVVGQGVGSIIGIVVAAAFFYAMVLVVNAGAGPIEAISGSWKMVKPEFASYIGMTLALQLIVMAGAFACGVGMLITAPMLPCTVVAAYMYHTRRR